MAEKDCKKKQKTEYNRLKRILTAAKVPGESIKILDPVLLNVAWMAAKLDAARDLIGNEDITVEYNNGGGQEGTRENPAFKAYEALWKSYISGMQRILEALPKGQDAQETQSPSKAEKSVMQLVQERKKA